MTTNLRWYGCTTFELSIDNVVVLLDAYVDRAAGADGPGTRATDIDRVDWILVGHSHFDHLYGADVIARRTGATVVGSYETVRVLRDQGVPSRQLLPVAGGELITLTDRVSAQVFPSLHSASWAHAVDPAIDDACFGDLGVSAQERRRRTRSFDQLLAAVGSSGREHLKEALAKPARGDGGPLVFLVRSGDRSLLFQDTAGAWSSVLDSLRPDVAILSAAGRPILDGEPWQGSLVDFLVFEMQQLNTPRVILGHHDDWLPGFSVPSDVERVRQAAAMAGLETTVDELPYDTHYSLGW